MWTAALALAAQGLRICADWFDGENTADMVAAKKAQAAQAAKDAINKDVAGGNVKAVQEDLAQ